MDELDFLKNHWQKEQRFPQIKAKEIRAMAHRSSSSVVKWIFVISILEFFLGWAISFFLPSVEYRSTFEEIFVTTLEVVFYVVIIYFIYQFFASFRTIRNTKDTKSLLTSIIDTRAHVERYIKFNIYYFYFGFLTAGGFTLYEKVAADSNKSIGTLIVYIVLFAILMAIISYLFIRVVRFYYRIVYGLLLKRLNKNYEELLQLEQEVE
ncbi:hypothetical protein [Sphingobacterium chungjuense]|uniref:hypothetical protein n=1 Tax=Sphingobacterium chungjuense TaxID=2675553 RepID=UPI00140BB38C|nr:hypothetical protein [Sphingobacterium chungjuense]